MIAGVLTEPAPHHDVAAGCMCSTSRRVHMFDVAVEKASRGGRHTSRSDRVTPPRAGISPATPITLVAAAPFCQTSRRRPSVQRRGGGNASRREAHLPPRPRNAAASGRIPRHPDHTGSRRGPMSDVAPGSRMSDVTAECMCSTSRWGTLLAEGGTPPAAIA